MKAEFSIVQECMRKESVESGASKAGDVPHLEISSALSCYPLAEAGQ